MKAKCHAAHVVINSMLQCAQNLLYWPGMPTDVRKKYVETCGVCALTPVKQPPEPIISRDVPERPWQQTGSDMSFEGQTYLITTDCHFSIEQLTDTSAEAMIRKLKKNFARHSIPEEFVKTDCGTQYTAKLFKKFANKWGFHHVSSSPGKHRANGATEAAVKTAKRLSDAKQLGKIHFRPTKPMEYTN